MKKKRIMSTVSLMLAIIMLFGTVSVAAVDVTYTTVPQTTTAPAVEDEKSDDYWDGYYDGYDVKSTTNIFKDENYAYCIVRSNKAIAFAAQINEVEAGRMEKRFSDWIRGLDTFGSKVIDENRIQVVKVPLA